MKKLVNLVIILGIIFLCMTCVTQQVENTSDQNSSNTKSGEKWLWQRDYIYPVANSASVNPRDKDYKLVKNWEFNNKQDFLTDWERLDGIRGNQLMYYRDDDANYEFKRDRNNNYLYLNTIYHKPGVTYHGIWPRDFDLAYDYSSAECSTKESYKYGYFEARMKLPGFVGAHSAFWLFSKGYKGNAQEIDIMESTSGGVLDTRRHKFTTNFSEYFHPTANADKKEFIYMDDFSNSLSDAFHVYAVEWTPFDLRYYIDNQLIRIERIPSEWETFPCFVRLGVEVDYWNTPTEKVFDPFIVDYVRVYQKNEIKQNARRPGMEYESKIIKADEWITVSIKNPSTSKKYSWEVDGNAEFVDNKDNSIRFKLKRGRRSAIIGLTSSDKSGSSEKNSWKEQVRFTDILPMNFELLVYKTICNDQGKGKVTVKNKDLRKFGVYKTTFNVYKTNKNGEVVWPPIETIEVPSPGQGVFWLDPQKHYWVEHTVKWPEGGSESSARNMIYPVLDPSFSPRIYVKNVGNKKKLFVDGHGVNPNQIHRWRLYRTNLNRSSPKYLESYENTGSNSFCFDLSRYSAYEHFMIEHEMEQANSGKCFPTETQRMYFNSNQYKDKAPGNTHCP